MTLIRALWIIGLTMGCLWAQADPLYEAVKKYQNGTLGEHPQMVTLLEMRAEEGNANAAFLLATAYKNGILRSDGSTEVLYWYEKAAEFGDHDAILMIGWLYYKGGEGIEVDEKKAKTWFEKAASHGVKEAQQMLQQLAGL